MVDLTPCHWTWLTSHRVIGHGWPHTVSLDMVDLTPCHWTWLTSHRVIGHGWPHTVSLDMVDLTPCHWPWLTSHRVIGHGWPHTVSLFMVDLTTPTDFCQGAVYATVVECSYHPHSSYSCCGTVFAEKALAGYIWNSAIVCRSFTSYNNDQHFMEFY